MGRRNGEWVYGEVVPEYQELWQTACKWWDYIKEGLQDSIAKGNAENEPFELSVGELCTMAAGVLANNYRVSAEEIGFLGLMTDDDAALILHSLVGLERVFEITKKKLNRLSSTPASVAG